MKSSPRLARILNLDEFEEAARRHLPRPIFGYVSGAAENNVSLRDNRAVFDEIGLVPRVLVDVSRRSAATEVFGHLYDQPFGIAPMGVSALTAYRGDVVLAEGAARANLPMIMSTSSLIAMEEVAKIAPDAWFQAYLLADQARTLAFVDRIARAGFRTLVITVDSAVVPSRENNLRTGFVTPLRPGLKLLRDGMVRPRWSLATFLRTFARHGMPHFENASAERGEPLVSRHVERSFAGREHLDWDDLTAIRQRWTGTLVLKGVLHADDARRARDAGVDGVIVSNHGGRQLDGAVSPMRALPGVVAVAGGMTVMIDSGFRRGTDVLKAIALGARCVFVGRPFNYAAAVGGAAGVARAIGLLSAEVRADMGLIGVNRLDELGPQHLKPLAWQSPARGVAPVDGRS